VANIQVPTVTQTIPPNQTDFEAAWLDVERTASQFLLSGKLPQMADHLAEAERSLKTRFPHMRARLRWRVLQWEIMGHERGGDSRKAIAALRRRLRMRGESPYGRLVDYLSLGDLLAKQGNKRDAEVALRRGIRYGLRHPEATLVTLLAKIDELGLLSLRADYVRALRTAARIILGEETTPPDSVEAFAHEVSRCRAELNERPRR
jgi:hypothetical protein